MEATYPTALDDLPAAPARPVAEKNENMEDQFAWPPAPADQDAPADATRQPPPATRQARPPDDMDDARLAELFRQQGLDPVAAVAHYHRVRAELAQRSKNVEEQFAWPPAPIWPAQAEPNADVQAGPLRVFPDDPDGPATRRCWPTSRSRARRRRFRLPSREAVIRRPPALDQSENVEEQITGRGAHAQDSSLS